MKEDRNIFLFVIWSKACAHEAKIVEEISNRFRVLRDFNVSWPKRHFAATLRHFTVGEAGIFGATRQESAGLGRFAS